MVLFMKHYSNAEFFTSLENQLKEFISKVDGETEAEKATYALHIMENIILFLRTNYLRNVSQIWKQYIFLTPCEHMKYIKIRHLLIIPTANRSGSRQVSGLVAVFLLGENLI